MYKPTALVIEDDKDVAFLFSAVLERAHYCTETILDGQVALERIAQIVPDIIVLDLFLPRVSGIKIFETLMEDPRMRKTRIIVATADARQADMFRKEADLVLIKPIGIDQLREFVTRFRKQIGNLN